MTGDAPHQAGNTDSAGNEQLASDLGTKCQDMVRSGINAFVSAAVQQAAENGGTLTAAQLEGLRDEFHSNIDNLAEPCDRFLTNILRSRANGRSKPFHRLIVSRFEHMLAGPTGARQTGNGELPRRFLPGFFVAMDRMLGEDRIAEYESQCTGIIERLQGERGQAFSWADVYADGEANRLVIDPLVEIAVLFDNLERRAAWFVELVNTHLGEESDRTQHHDTGDWRLTDWTLQHLLRNMFSDLDDAFRDETLRAYIAERFGKRTCATVENVLGRIREISDEDVHTN